MMKDIITDIDEIKNFLKERAENGKSIDGNGRREPHATDDARESDYATYIRNEKRR